MPLLARQLYLRPLYEFAAPAGTLAVADTLAYIPTADTLSVQRLRQGGKPEPVGSVTLPCAPSGSQLVGNLLYLTCPQGLQVRVLIVDVNEPRAPRMRGGYLAQQGVFQARFDSHYGYNIGTWRFSLCCQGAVFEVYDLADPDAPKQVASNGFQFGGYYDSAVEAPLVYLVGYDALGLPRGAAGLTIVDTSSAAPFVVRSANSPSGAANRVRVAGGIVLVYAAGGADIQLIDAHDPAAPAARGTLSIAGAIVDVQTAAGYAYIALRDGAMLIADVRDPAKPQIVGRHTLAAQPLALIAQPGRVVAVTVEQMAYVLELAW